MNDTTIETEITVEWCDMDVRDRQMVVIATTERLKRKDYNTFSRIFCLANAKIVLGQAEGKKYFRLHEDSRDVLKILFNNYL